MLSHTASILLDDIALLNVVLTTFTNQSIVMYAEEVVNPSIADLLAVMKDTEETRKTNLRNFEDNLK